MIRYQCGFVMYVEPKMIDYQKQPEEELQMEELYEMLNVVKDNFIAVAITTNQFNRDMIMLCGEALEDASAWKYCKPTPACAIDYVEMGLNRAMPI